MGTIKALLVGIDDYPASVASALGGCANDIAEAGRLLTDLAGEQADVTVLLNADATVAAVTDAILRHLGSAGPDDTALLWFSGHGTQEAATGDDLLIEATGLNQALVCVDGPLLDKRLGALLDRVAAGGAQVTAVLDCCHSGGATREAELTERYAPPRPEWDFGARAHGGPPRHVLLAASRLDEPSYEGWFEGRRHGAFTHALVGAVRAAGPGATCRELLAAAAARVQRAGSTQHPVLFPDLPGGAADRPLLGGAPRTASPHLLRYGADGWEVDCGAVHGLREGGAEAQGTTFAALEEGPGRGVVRAVEVSAARTLVAPVDWEPEPERVYPVALSDVALPPASVAVDGSPEDVRRLATALGPLVRLVDGAEEALGLHFRVRVRDGRASVLRRDGTEFTAPLPFAVPADAGRVADCLAHLTRWHQLRDLTPRPSLLDGLVELEITPWGSAEPLRPDASGEIVCAYSGGLRPPWVSIRLHNRSPDRTLWCVLLDLTDDYASSSALYPGHFIGPGRTGHALDGDPVQLSLPASRAVAPGAEARDWFKLIVADRELSTVPFRLPAWDAATGRRIAGPVLGAAGRWTAVTVPLRTLVPEPVSGPDV
ncbi:caspase family protein [Streptomyces sp. Ag109_G2-15]|uniref:caspase family protein n=1 Tax=Streptomyces sp. Ag109_G2-15 TaxID=1938850 RepID=UPI000BD5F7D1|nr:caspase family protein [Streptomyces sp. Ag109_G2-15]SOD84123.1 Caspase domain-containing protein [Streptomyces sp. Ag109_G2-15]